MNGLAEAFNKTLGKNIVSKNKRDWHDKLYEALWAYRTSVRTPTQMTPYSLVFGALEMGNPFSLYLRSFYFITWPMSHKND